MSKDYYKTLGIDKNATTDEVKKAFRKLAHTHHPDKKGGDDAKFKEANEAYGVLSDQKKRAQYDQFGSEGPMGGGGFGGGAGAGGFNPNDFGFDFSGFQQGGFSQNGGAEFDLNDLFSGIFGGGRQRMRRGRDIQVDVDLTFEEAAFGIEKTINLRKGVTVNIPPGLDTGEMVRLTGAGEPIEGGQSGDLYIRVHVKRHATLKKVGHNLITEIEIKLTDAILGTVHSLKTLDGEIDIKVPEGVVNGDLLRVKEKGIALTNRGKGGHRGDILITVKVKMPKKLSKAAKQAVEELKKEGI